MVTTQAPSASEVRLTLKLRGGNRELFAARDPEILAEGPAGTGKTRTILELINLLCHHYPGLRVLIVRRHQVTLTTTALVTFDSKVLTPYDGVTFFGGSKHEASGYRYPNGSRIVVGGMDNADKILSSEYDLVYCNESTELGVEAWETLISRLRNGVLPAARIIGDCNPAHSTHWLLQRAQSGKVRHIKSRLQDNPAYYDDDGTPTEEGAAYIARLQQLSGSRYQRLVLGEWVGYENAVYPHFDRRIHVQDIPEGIRFVDGAFGADFGRVHKSATVAVSRDQLGRLWIREAWGRPSDDHGSELRRIVAQLRSRYSLRRGRTDPNQDVLAGLLGANIAKSGEGSRQHRIDLTSRLLNTYPGGIVPSLNQETRGRALPYGPNAADDTRLKGRVLHAFEEAVARAEIVLAHAAAGDVEAARAAWPRVDQYIDLGLRLLADHGAEECRW